MSRLADYTFATRLTHSLSRWRVKQLIEQSAAPDLKLGRAIVIIYHNIFTETVNKIALSADDDKRVVMEDKISTLAIGHYRAEKYDIANMIRLNLIKDD